MSKDYMVIIVKPPDNNLKIIKIPKRLRDMEKLVNGTIEEKRYEKILLIYNENQNDNSLKVNKVFEDVELKGTVLLVGNDEKTGDVRSLRKQELAKYISKINGKDLSKEKEI